MHSSTSQAESAIPVQDAVVFDVDSLWTRLNGLTDSRHRRGLRYTLPVILLLVILAKFAGEDTPSGIADWAKYRKGQLIEALHLRYRQMPHSNTFRRILQNVVQPDELQKIVSEFFKSLSAVGSSLVVSIDGKTMRGTIDTTNPRGEHLLAAYLPEEGIVLMQVPAGDQENEITVAPGLLKCVDLRGKVVTGDAIHAQRELSAQVLEAEGDYLWLVKDNQPTLREDIEQVFAPDKPTVVGGRVPNDIETFRTVNKGHGRLEIREITVSSMLKGYSDWPGLEQVFRLERWRCENKSGKVTTETVYGATSLRRDEASPSRLLYLSRVHWRIENGLHYCRDVTFKEDRCRLTRGNAGWVMAIINNLVIGLLRFTGETNLAQARRKLQAGLSQSLSLLAARPLRL